MGESDLVKKAKELSISVFKDKAFEGRSFHNLEHTINVVNAAQEIGNQTALTADELDSLIVAGWLHDIGYIDGGEEHEFKAAERAKELLIASGASHNKIMDVTEAIIATKVPQRPRSLISKVLCDADLYHLSTDQCDKMSAKLREEWETLGEKKMSEKEWIESNLTFMENHQFHTPYGKAILQQGKKKNIKKLRKLMEPEINERN